MNKKSMNNPLWTAIIGVLSSFAIGFIASFIFEDVSAGEIIASGSTVTGILVVLAIIRNQGEQKEEGKNNEKGEK